MSIATVNGTVSRLLSQPGADSRAQVALLVHDTTQ